MSEHKCFRKGGRREAAHNSYAEREGSEGCSCERAKQFAAFDALRGFEDFIEEAKLDAEETYDR